MSDGFGLIGAQEEAFRRALGLLHRGHSDQAIVLLAPLYEEHPAHVEVALNLGGAYILENRFEEALEVLEQVATHTTDNENVWVNLAAARLGPLESSTRQQQEHAIEAYQEALRANPAVPNVHYMLGLIYGLREDDMRAAAHFTRALEQNPDDNDARRMLAAVAARTVERSKRANEGLRE